MDGGGDICVRVLMLLFDQLLKLYYGNDLKRNCAFVFEDSGVFSILILRLPKKMNQRDISLTNVVLWNRLATAHV